MFDQLLGAILFFFGLAGSVKGESTQSAAIAMSFEATLANMGTNREMWDAQKASRSASFSSQLATFKNTKKKQTLNDVQLKIQVMRKNQEDFLLKELSTLNTVCQLMTTELESWTTMTKKDGSSVTKTITSAQKLIIEASVLLATMMGKPYVVSVSNGEKNIRADAEKVRTDLEQDTKSVYNKFKQAREKTKQAYKEYRQLTGKTLKMPMSSSLSEDASASKAAVMTMTPTPSL